MTRGASSRTSSSKTWSGSPRRSSAVTPLSVHDGVHSGEATWGEDAEKRNLKVFVYGTLKRGFRNHERLCRGAASIEAATTKARLYDLPFGFPALVVPEADVRASGTADYLADAARSGGAYEPCADLREPWDTVYGELLGFDDPENRLAALDALEGFRPGEAGLYRRVLIPVESSETGEYLLAWAYATRSPSGVYLPGGRWPS